MFPGMCYTWLPAGAEMAGGLGLWGIGKRQCITPELSALNLLLLLSSTYDSPRQELVPEGSSFLQAEENTPCKCKAQTPSQGACATDPWLTAPAEAPKFIPAHLPHTAPDLTGSSEGTSKPTKPSVMYWSQRLPSSIAGRQHLGSETDDPPLVFPRPAWHGRTAWSWAGHFAGEVL